MSHPLTHFNEGNVGARPRVLLVDDHRKLLDAVSAMLTDAFDVVGTTTDGRQALELARRADPDVIVLDVDMPGMDGFRTLRELRHGGVPTPVVFLSMHDADDVITEAFQCGGRGYVLKSRVGRDLTSALDHVLLGRSFVPSLTSLFELANTGGHAMQIHGDMESFLDSAATFLDLALRRGDATCVVASASVREGVGHRLRARGWNVGGSSGHKRCLVIDAADALNRFMRDGVPDADTVGQVITELDQYRLAVAEGPTSRLTICGDIAVSLAADGNDRGVVAVESLWDTLTKGLPFLTLCTYPSSCFHGVPDLWSDVGARHWAVTHAGDL